MRKKRWMWNTITSLINQLLTMICGFILPKLFLTYYGSDTNGLISSITSFLGLISFLELGVGAVVQSELYKPLVNNDENQISKIVKSANKFFKKIAIILLIYTIILSLVYPIITINRFDYVYTFLLIIIISISLFAQYYFGITYQLLLNADQRSYVQLIIQIITLLLNTICCFTLITKGFSIHIVKLSTSFIFILRPILMSIYVKNKYKINKTIELKEEPIKQKWNGLSQHLSAVVLSNTDITILTLFSTLQNVSVYTVYNLVVTGIKQIIISITTGTSALFGNMIAKNENKLLLKTFEKFEIIIHFVVVTLFTCTAMLIIPFIRIYTNGITDTNYILPIFSILITIAQASYCLRLPYNIIVLAAGHYKETQLSAIIEMIINIVISLFGVIKFGIVGVVLGTFIAMTYRTIYLVNYLKYNIINRKLKYFIKHIIIDIIIVIISIMLCKNINFNVYNYSQWILLSIKVIGITLVNALLINLIGYYTVIVSNFNNKIK